NSAQALKGTIFDSPTYLGFWSIFIFISEVLNFYSHIHLRSLRTPVGEPRRYPTGLGFGTTVCANYFYEALGLIGLFAITGGDLGVIAYIAVAVIFMHRWSGQKYRRYTKEFDSKVFPGKRWKMFPLIY
ncbi:MAG: 3-oxo-5a-steroid 4- dehydrogenase, partial [Tremellales sp. Tagirdzhanova-0007]